MAGLEEFGGGSGGLSDITGGLTDIFGSSQDIEGTGTRKGTTTQTEQLMVDEEAINRIVEEMLSSTGGLADIFSEEQVAGLFDSSVASQASGDLIAKVAGEIAKLTSPKETVTEVDEETTSQQTTSSGGLLGQAKSIFSGGLF